MKKRDIVFGLVTGMLGIFLTVGVQTFARPCVHADGSAAMCTPVRTWLTGAGGAIAVLAGISMLRPNTVTRILAAAGGLLAILIPGILVPVCKADTMACRQVTQPFALVTGVLILIAALLWTVVSAVAGKQEDRS